MTIKTIYLKRSAYGFEEIEGNKFMGIIKGVTNEGKLELQLENDSLKTYNIKEIRMFY